MMKVPRKNKTGRQGEKGFALLIAVVVASILISITYVMFSITLKQVALSTSGKNSQIALYAADSGIECGLYADYRIADEFYKVVTTPNANQTYYTTTFNTGERKPFKCNSRTINNLTSSTSVSLKVAGVVYSGIATSFYVPYPTNNEQQCAYVTVTYYKVPVSTVNGGVTYTYEQKRTKLESRGYNTCPVDATNGQATPNDPQRLERGLEVYY